MISCFPEPLCPQTTCPIIDKNWIIELVEYHRVTKKLLGNTTDRALFRPCHTLFGLFVVHAQALVVPKIFINQECILERISVGNSAKNVLLIELPGWAVFGDVFVIKSCSTSSAVPPPSLQEVSGVLLHPPQTLMHMDDHLRGTIMRPGTLRLTFRSPQAHVEPVAPAPAQATAKGSCFVAILRGASLLRIIGAVAVLVLMWVSSLACSSLHLAHAKDAITNTDRIQNMLDYNYLTVRPPPRPTSHAVQVHTFFTCSLLSPFCLNLTGRRHDGAHEQRHRGGREDRGPRRH